MRLVDADAFIEYLGLDDENARKENLCGIVTLEDFDEQPTAYDVDKVVKQLKQQAEQYRERGFEADRKGVCNLADKYYAKQCSYLHAIEIVKAGVADGYKD